MMTSLGRVTVEDRGFHSHRIERREYLMSLAMTEGGVSYQLVVELYHGKRSTMDLTSTCFASGCTAFKFPPQE